MKAAFILPFIVVCLAGTPLNPARAQAPAPAGSADKAPMEVEAIRSTSGRVIDASGLASKPYPVSKGARFDLVSEAFADVVVTRRGVTLRLAKADVKIYEKDLNAPPPARPQAPTDPRIEAEAAAAKAEAAALAAFKPGGTLVVLSAKYSLQGNQPRNVKTKLEKLIPAGALTAPVRIPVTDELSRAAANQPSVTATRSGDYIYYREAPKNVLTVVYQYNGQTTTKQAIEGTMLFLP